ncbi:hypothetical protein BST94_09670 [Nonlabens xylanidelens]|nr:hypothetical protein BST94_09670 [Nonlabens xylanidelens]
MASEERAKQSAALVPKLRFKEFDGEWEKKKLGEITKINQGLQIAIKDRFLEEVENSFFYITNEFLRAGSTKKYFIKNPTESVLCTEEDILMTRTGNTGQVVTGVRGAFHNNFFKIKFTSSINKWFFFYFLTDYKTQNEILKLAGTSTIPDLNHSDFYRLKINLPSLKEQQKTATFLTAVDKKISQLTSKKQQLTKYKKGVMQQLFSQELRFKDENGNDFPDWEEKRLGEVAKYYDGTHQTPKYVEEGIPFYSVEHVTANQFSKTKFITNEVFEKENKRVKLERGDILMTRIGDIGTSRLIDWDVNASFYVSLALLKQNETFNSTYLNQFISSRFFQNELWKRTIHVAFPKKINLGEIGNCKVKLPNLKEQQKIASYLSALDDEIEAVQVQIEQTQVFKKGLLQQLFV